MVDLMHFLTNLLFFNIPLLHCYTSLNSSITCCLSSGDMYLFFVASISLLVSSFFSATLLNIIPLSAPEIFLMHLLFYQQFCYQLYHQLLLFLNCFFFEAVFIASIVDFFNTIKQFLTIFIA